jgi:hypothetical protein
MATIKKFFHSDSGHGWLAVKRKEVEQLGIADKVSNFSYAKGKTVYLEEDTDAGLFLNAAKAAGLEVEVKDAKPVKRSNIRGFSAYSVEA